ncbi:MAG: ribosome assembly RNA-binding protein YhbY [Myxococcota bacterium]
MKNTLELTGRQKRHLRGLAHHLKPIVIIGADRVTDGVVRKVDAELNNHELIKVRLTDADKDEVREAQSTLCNHTQAAHVQTIGHTLILYRPHPKEPKIRLPRPA